MASSIESLIISLFESLNDKDDSVRDAVASSLHTIGIHQPVTLLNAAHAFLASRHAKLTSAHRGSLLNVMKLVCAEKLVDIPENLAALIINLATQEITFAKEVIDEWQGPASGLLTVLSRRHCNAVMESLLQKFQPGISPHPYVLNTLGDVAAANAFGFVLFLTDILSRMTPMLNGVKQDSLRFAFVTASKKFCESVLEYTANIDASPDPSVKKETFSTQFSAIYDVFYSSWLQSKESKTRGAVLECLGELCHVLPEEKLREEIKRLTPYAVSAVKKPTEPLPVTHGLCRLLEAAINDQTCLLDPYLDDIWAALFPLVSFDSDRLDTLIVRCQNEALRCFHVTATKYSDRLVYCLIQKLQSTQEKTKISALVVLRHLVNASGPYVEDKKSLIVMALKSILNDPSNKVKKWLCHLTLALGDHGYLDVDNGSLLIEFIVKQLALPDDDKKSTEIDAVTNKLLRYQCGQALYSLANNVRHAEHVLWPYLFEFLCVESYAGAVSDICRSLAPLAQRMNAEKRLNIVYANNERLPGPHQILARLLVCLGVPEVRHKRAANVIQLLKETSSFFFPALPTLWDHELVVLSNILDDGIKDAEGEWEQAVFKFIAKTVDAVGDEEWICALAAALGKQFNLYSNYLEEKRFLFKTLGGVLAKVRNLQFVVDHLDLMFRNVNHSHFSERLGCAQGVGYCSSSHVDIVLTKLENVAKLEYQKKSTGLLGWVKDTIPMKSENDAEIANLKATLMLSYGYVTFYCPVKLVIQKLESIILRFLTPYFENAKETVVKQALLRTADLIALTVHPTHLTSDYKFAARNQLLHYMKEYVKAESPETMTSNIRILAVNAAASYAKLDPPMVESDTWSMCTVFAHHIYSVQSVKIDSDSENDMTTTTALTALNALFEQVLLKQATSERLASLLKLLQSWFSSDNALERERSIDSAYHLLKVYYTMADVVLGHATEFSLMGSLLGRFCPRFCDSIPSIRRKALECVHWLLAVSVIHMGHGKNYRDSVVDSVLDYGESLNKADINAHLSVIVQISKVLDQRLPGKQIQNYLTVLFDLVLDKQPGVSAAAATLLKLQLTTKGQQLVTEAEKVVTILLLRLNSLQSSCLQTYAECLQALHEFAKHHLHLTVATLLAQQLPYSQSVCDCWRSLSRDSQLLPSLLDQLLEIVTVEAPYEMLESSNLRYARCPPLAAVAALTIVSLHIPETVHQQWFSKICACLLVQSGCLADTTFVRNPQITSEFHKQNTPATVVRDSLRSLLARHPITYALDERTWTDFEDPLHYSDAVSCVAKAIGTNAPELIEPMVSLLKDCQSSKLEGARIVGAAVYSAFVKFCQQQDEELIESIVTCLMAGLADSSLNVRKICVRGMGYVAHCSYKILEKYTQAVLSAMMAGLEDPTDHKDEVALEAMQGLGRLTVRVPKEQIERILVYILLRIRPCFEKSSGAVRAVAFSLFGSLARFGSCEAYAEQIHSNIVSLLLHLNDEVEEVRTACVEALSSIGPLTESTTLREYFEKSLPDVTRGATQLNYSDFLKESAKLMVTSYPDRVNFYALCCANYLKSSSSRIRCNAALFIGFLLGAVPHEKRTTISKDLIFSGLALLLKEPETDVRLSAAEAIAYLHGY